MPPLPRDPISLLAAVPAVWLGPAAEAPVARLAPPLQPGCAVLQRRARRAAVRRVLPRGWLRHPWPARPGR
jgi:hypothetical protein